MNFTKDDKLALIGFGTIIIGIMVDVGLLFGIGGLIFVKSLVLLFIVVVFLSQSRKMRKQISISQHDTKSYLTLKLNKP